MCVIALTFARYMNAPLRADESDWPEQVKAIAVHGVPRLSFEEARLQHNGSYYGYGAYYGMWHPPLYHYTLTAAYLLGGDRDWIYRSVGAILLVGSLLALFGLARREAGVEGLAQWLPVAIPLLLPLVVEGSLFVDIDNTTLMFTMAMTLRRFFRPGDPYSPLRTIELAAWFCLALMSKLTTPVVLMGALGLYALIGRRPVRGVLSIAAASAAAAGAFAFLYWTYCAAFDYPLWFMFDVNYLGKRNLYSSIKRLPDILFAIRWHAVWATAIFWILLGSVTLRRIARYARRREPEPVDLLLIFSWATFACYAVIGAMWGKYTVPAALFGGVAVGIELARAWGGIELERPRAFKLALAGLAIVASVLPVPYSRLPSTERTADFARQVLDPRNVSAGVVGALAGGIAFMGARRWIRAATRVQAAEVALAASLAVVAMVTVPRVMLSTDDRGPFRPYRERGFRETAAYLNAHATAADAIMGEKEFARYFHGRVFHLGRLLATPGPAGTLDLARRPDVRFIVDSATYPDVLEPGFFDALDIARVESIGDFRIYVKR